MNVALRTSGMLVATAFLYLFVWFLTWTVYLQPYPTQDSRDYDYRTIALENPTAERMQEKFVEFKEQGWDVLNVEPSVTTTRPEVLFYSVRAERQPSLLEFPGLVTTWLLRLITLAIVLMIVKSSIARNGWLASR
jgi:hypothetical protein